MTKPRGFTCHEFRAAFSHGNLAGHSGVNVWTVRASEVSGYDHHAMVETHESLHGQLNGSTCWGLVSSLCSILADRGARRRSALGEAFWRMTDGARETHECYATTMSAGLLGVKPVRRMLASNNTYL